VFQSTPVSLPFILPPALEGPPSPSNAAGAPSFEFLCPDLLGSLASPCRRALAGLRKLTAEEIDDVGVGGRGTAAEMVQEMVPDADPEGALPVGQSR